MLEVSNAFTFLAWFLLCGSIVVVVGAAVMEFSDRSRGI